MQSEELKRKATAFDDMSPDESIGAFGGSGQWVELCTVRDMRKLETALPVANPIRWMWEERRFAESDIWDDMYDDEPPAPHKQVRNIRPLYAAPPAPPAPSVAVKALDFDAVYVIPREMTDDEWVDVKYNVDRKANPDIELWRIKEAVKYANFIAGHRGRSALSAQVQDESEVIDCLLAGKPFVFDPATNFCHADDGGAPEHGIKYVPAAQEQDVVEAPPVDSRHRFEPNSKYPWFCAVCGYAPHEPLKHLPAAPAKQEGSNNG
ncbi:hypothetical protein G6L13_05385 [Agrobacterium tumefaciens]|uniref:hypothetical protein n=1 Tax=Agrobacterium tumefaciens TaxID=358 RepID=UPI001573E346|nr:hypothetical protein [Agrobacterium tumefaciens]NTA79917.1 hypothetical protein [Agrobacterium tumefaciens]